MSNENVFDTQLGNENFRLYPHLIRFTNDLICNATFKYDFVFLSLVFSRSINFNDENENHNERVLLKNCTSSHRNFS